MKLHAYRRVFALVSVVGLTALTGCGDPCLDDGRGKGNCNAQDGDETTDTNQTEDETAEAEATAEGVEADAGDGCMNDMQDGDETDVDCGGSCVDMTDDSGKCDEGQLCDIDDDCITGFCDAGVCGQVDACLDGMVSGDETDVDCGGSCVEDANDPQNPAGKCDEGELCSVDGDCVTNLCDNGTCTSPLLPCENMMTDGDETDEDCGGSCVEDPDDPQNPAGKCTEGELCIIDGDCATDFCDAGTCAIPPGCMNMMADMDETDEDCGGVCVEDPNDPQNPAGKCDEGQLCLLDSDCVTNFCDQNGMCALPPCMNMMTDPEETDEDCGGACVVDPDDPQNPEGKCDLGEGCLIDSDCQSNACDADNNICVEVCMNNQQDVPETDIDCGGPCVVDPNDENNPAGKCEEGEGCLIDSDCETHACDENNMICATPCTDGDQNGDETDVDCGGACVMDPNDPNNPEGKCDDGLGCLVNSDCESNVCDPDLMICVGPCNNGMQEMGETDLDCGGVCVEDANDPQNPEGKCGPDEACLIDSDCTSNVCDPDLLICVDVCMNGMQDEPETDVDCGGGCVEYNPDNPNDVEGQCGQDDACVDAEDCLAGDCENGMCNLCGQNPDYTDCATCLITNCCANVISCLEGTAKCPCWFNCIAQPGATTQGCQAQCGNGNLGPIQSCISNSCMASCQ